MSDPSNEKIVEDAMAGMRDQMEDSHRMMMEEVDAYRQTKIKRLWTVLIVIALIVVAVVVFT